MTANRIESLDDPRVRPYRDLTKPSRIRPAGRFVVEGEQLTRRLLASSYNVESLLLDEMFVERLAITPPAEAALFVASRELLRQIVGYRFHRGVLACGLRRPSPTLAELAEQFGDDALVVVCPDIDTPENLGGIVRSCVAFGVDAIVLGPECIDTFARRVARVSMGAVFSAPIVECVDIAKELHLLRDTFGFDLAAAVIDSQAEPLPRAKRSRRMALLLGNEFSGLAPQWTAMCNRQITLPMTGDVNSLNVSVAAGVMLYHFLGGSD